jgi:cyclophilin family peptidyl-prolyl cis-trans isomerase
MRCLNPFKKIYSMSNKTFAYVLAIIILVAAGAFAVWRLQENRGTVKNTMDQYSQNQNTQPNPNNQNVPTPQEAQPSAGTSTAQSINGCTRNFDEQKLKTAQVSIAGRQAEIDVKGYGKITVSFYEKDAPKTVENFLRLANAGYFDCLTFHRIAKGFVIQGGDPTGTGSGGDSAFGGEFADEISATSQLYKTGYKKGVLAMANRGANTNTSQFFIMLADADLPPAYTIFGKVVNGLDVVDKIGAVEIIPQMGPNDGAPKTPVVMEKVSIIK